MQSLICSVACWNATPESSFQEFLIIFDVALGRSSGRDNDIGELNLSRVQLPSRFVLCVGFIMDILVVI